MKKIHLFAVTFLGMAFFPRRPIASCGTIAMKTQEFPNTPNRPGFPATFPTPGEIYKHACIYKFPIKK